LLSLGPLKHTRRWHSNYINNQLELFTLVGAWKQWESSEKLDHDAAEAPHVNLLSVRKEAKNDVGRSVEPALNVGVDYLVFETSTAKVGNDNA
jgi:hypothetical protein